LLQDQAGRTGTTGKVHGTAPRSALLRTSSRRITGRIDQFTGGRFILVFFHRLNATEPPNRLLTLVYFLKTRDFAGHRLLSISEIFI
tara:strand:- start:315 stop:575 length:261 start_codon:yes stop_codon:yes gene_type:complete